MSLKGFLEGFQSSFSQVERGVTNLGKNIERTVVSSVYRAKRQIFYSILELFFLICGVAIFLVGLLLFLTRFAPTDVVLLIVGLVLVNIVLLAGKFR